MTKPPAPHPQPAEPVHWAKERLRRLPMLARYPIIAGAIGGILLRLAFSGPAGSSWSAMAGAFIFFAPLLVGMITVYLAERQSRRSWWYYFAASALATTLFVAGTLLILIEGLICAIVIVPMFACMGGIGGVLMGTICRLTHWPRHTLYSFAALPFVIVLVADHLPRGHQIGEIERSVLIVAPAETIWQQLNGIEQISEAEMADAWAMRIGVPMPLSGATRETAEGRVRASTWGAQVHFDELIQDWQPEQYLRWTYRFDADSFPRHALDDHVVIGGHYFDLIDTSYTLTPGTGGVLLTTKVRYRISTEFNFYADWAAQLLLGNLSEVGLRLYKSRSEAAWQAQATAAVVTRHAH